MKRNDKSDEERVLAATRTAMTSDDIGCPKTSAVRALCSLSKARFDAAAMRLSAAGSLCLYHHDAAAWLTEEEQLQLIHDSRGNAYNMMKAR